MRKVPQIFRTTAFLITAGLLSPTTLHGQTTGKQRGVRPTPTPASVAVAPPGPFFALVIGNNNYEYLPKLQTAANDAAAVAQLLHDRYGFQTRLLTNATRDQIITALADYRHELGEDSSLVVYFAGHGYNDREAGEAYWLPVDAQKDNNKNWISADDITRAARAIAARHVLVIADSCYSGGLARDADWDIDLGQRRTFLAKMLQSKSRTLMSSGGDEPVADGGAAGHSIFTWALLQGMNAIEDDEFTADDLFQRKIRQRVGGGSKQLPEYKTIRDSGHVAGDFVFFRSKKILPKTTATNSASGGGANEMVTEAKKYYEAKQYDRALPVFRTAAEAGNGEAARYLGSIYEGGLSGATKDAAQAVLWYRKAADAGDAIGMTKLGYAYETGEGGLPKDDVQAVGWYRRAAAAGYPLGMNHLGYMYETGRGGLAKDDAQAVDWYRKAANAGETHAMTNLGHAYETGLGGLAKNETEAATWYRKAADAGEPTAMTNLGHMYESGRGGLAKDDVQAVNWYRKAADAGNARAMASLGVFYETGRGGVPKDDAQAVEWYRKAADAGEPRAMTHLGTMYGAGRGGLQHDDAQAVAWYRKAADAGDAAGMSGLAYMYESGRGGLAKDLAQAATWYHRAAALGSDTAKEALKRLRR